MTLIVPTLAVPQQRLTTLLNQQACVIQVQQKTTGLFLNLYVNDALIIGGVICQDRNRIVRDAYLGFLGDLAFVDQQGVQDPDYTGLGTRFLLYYFAPGEI